jgi:hypothetical protein
LKTGGSESEGKISSRISVRDLRNQFPTKTTASGSGSEVWSRDVWSDVGLTDSHTSPTTEIKGVGGREVGEVGGERLVRGARSESQGAESADGSFMFGEKEEEATAAGEGEGVVETPFPHQPIMRVMRAEGGIGIGES